MITGVLLAVCLAALGYIAYLRLRAENYTRERFAFAALSAFIGFASLVGASLRESPSFVFLRLLNAFFPSATLKQLPQEVKSYDITILTLFLALVVYIVYQIYRTWPGAISINDWERLQRHEDPGLVQVAIVEGVRIIRRRQESPKLALIISVLFGASRSLIPKSFLLGGRTSFWMTKS